MNLSFMESVIWAFKQLYDKGLVYEGFRILPYCWNDQTPLSNHELRMDDDVYQNRQDPAITVGFRLETGELALIWTTTPWTLPSNMGVAVHPDVDYVVVEGDRDGGTDRYLLAEARLPAYLRDLGDDAAERIVARHKGSELLGRSYTPPFSYYEGYAGAHRILGGDFVTTEDGTGLVHMSPGLRRGRQADPGRCRRRDGRAGRAGRPVHLAGHRLRGHARLRRQPARHRPSQGAHAAGPRCRRR